MIYEEDINYYIIIVNFLILYFFIIYHVTSYNISILIYLYIYKNYHINHVLIIVTNYFIIYIYINNIILLHYINDKFITNKNYLKLNLSNYFSNYNDLSYILQELHFYLLNYFIMICDFLIHFLNFIYLFFFTNQLPNIFLIYFY